MSDAIFKQNYFEIFSLPVSTKADISQLKNKNRELQQQVHPDRFANGSESEKRHAMQVTSLINQAFETINDPALRLQYMLSLKGVDMNSETDTTMDAEFLMSQMELREKISDIRSRAEPLDVLDAMKAELNRESSELVDKFQFFYDSEAIDQGREIVRKLQFLNKAQKEISDISIQIEDELI